MRSSAATDLALAVSDTPLRVNDEVVHVTASFGLVNVTDELVSVQELLVATQGSLASSKNSGKNCVSRVPNDDGATPARAMSAVSAEGILDRNDLRVAAQQIVRLDTAETVGYELLTRGPEGPFESPDALFSLFAEANASTLADIRCLKNCIAASSLLEGEGTLHVNVFPSTLLELLPGRFDALLDSIPDLSRVRLEISEKQFLGDPVHLKPAIQRLRQSGIRIAIDDVGFGNSCLESILVLEPEIVKIDRRLVTDAHLDRACRSVLQRLIDLAGVLGAEIVAEGIEDEAAADLLRSMGVKYGQGYHYGRPALLDQNSAIAEVRCGF